MSSPYDLGLERVNKMLEHATEHYEWTQFVIWVENCHILPHSTRFFDLKERLHQKTIDRRLMLDILKAEMWQKKKKGELNNI